MGRLEVLVALGVSEIRVFGGIKELKDLEAQQVPRGVKDLVVQLALLVLVVQKALSGLAVSY